MATNPLHKYTVAESNNLQVYENYSYEVLNLVAEDSGAWGSATNITESNPAKEVVLIEKVAYESADEFYIVLNDAVDANDSTTVDGTDSKVIIVPQEALPFTIKGMLITKLEIAVNDDDSSERLGVLAFH
jgi:hypothetical protein